MPETRPDFYHCPDCNRSLNYEPRPAPWKVGDFVIHDADAKEPEYLMRVAVITGEHTCKVFYVNRVSGRRELQGLIDQHMCDLHDPARWGIDAQAASLNRKPRRMPLWERQLLTNQTHCPHKWSETPEGDYHGAPLYPCELCGTSTMREPARAPQYREALVTARREENPARIYLCDIPDHLRAEVFAAPNTWIATVIGCNPHAVVQYRQRHGIPPSDARGGPPRPGRTRWVEDMTQRLAMRA